jgi:hypothetical protein
MVVPGVDSDVIPVAGDFDGDGKTDVAVVDPTARILGSEIPNASSWFILLSGADNALRRVDFGAPGVLDRPAPADYDGDGITDIGTFRANSDLVPGAAQWFILPSKQNPGGFATTNGAFDVVFGAPGGVDLPAPFDFDGDGRADIATFRPISDQPGNEGNSQWFILPSGPNDERFSTKFGGFPVTFGAGGNADQPVVADYNNDGRDDIATFRSITDLTENIRWFVLPSAGDAPNFGNGFPVNYASDGQIAAISDYTGDGQSDLTVFNPIDNSWTIRSGTAGPEEPPVTFNPLGTGAVPVLSPLFFRLVATANENRDPGGVGAAMSRARASSWLNPFGRIDPVADAIDDLFGEQS